MIMTNELTLKEVCEGLFDLLDGTNYPEEINYNTGLPLERCTEILILKDKCYKYITLYTTELRSVL